MNRVVEPEILDELKPSDPRAVRARRDLQRINWWMGNARIIARAMQRTFPVNPPSRIIEMGTGDGSLLLRVASRLPRATSAMEVTLVDREPAVQASTLEAYRKLGWRVHVVTADIFEFLEAAEPTDVIIANLFLHHFLPNQLQSLFENAARCTQTLIACEPPRSRYALMSCRLMPLIGIGEVALYDAAVSIRAGFRDQELSALWPRAGGWAFEEGSSGPFSHLFVARKS